MTTVVAEGAAEERFAILPAIHTQAGEPADAMIHTSSAPPPPDAREKIAEAYETHYSLLEYLALRKFHVAEDDVRALIHDVFAAFIRNRSKIKDERSWLVGATCMQCRMYWRARGREDVLRTLDDDFDPVALADDVTTRVEVADVLRRLPRRCRRVLHLRFFEGLSSSELADRYTTTIDYARQLVYRCMANARALFARRGVR